MTIVTAYAGGMLGKALSVAGVLVLMVLLAAPASAAAGCEDAASAGNQTVAAGSCLRLGPGGTIDGPLVVEGRLLLEGTAADPVRVGAPVILRGESATIAFADFSDEAPLQILGGAGRKVDVTIADSTFAAPAGANAVDLTDAFRVDIVRGTFSGAGTSIHAIFGGHGSTLAVSESTFSGPGAAIGATMGAAGGERLALTANTFRGVAEPAESFASQLGLVYVRGGAQDVPGKAPIITLSGNVFEDATVGLSIESSNYRLLSTGDTFRRNTAGVLIMTEGRNAIFDRSTFDENTRWDIVLPSAGDATVKDPVKFDPRKVYVTEAGQVTLQEGKSRVAITYDYMVAHRGEAAAGATALAIFGLSFSASVRALFAKMLFVPLYARLSPEQVLNHEKRQDILQYVQQNPGVHLRRIGHALAISYGTLTYHLYRLEREGYITWAQEGLFKRYYTSAGRMKEAAKEKPMPTALRDLERQIYDTILANPGSAQSALAGKLGLSRQALHYHIKKLEKSGFISKVPHGRETLIYATQQTAPQATPEPANT